MANDEYQLKPAFDFDSNESNVLHHNVSASVCINGDPYPGTSEVRLDLLPQAVIRFYGSFKNIPFIKCVDPNVNISFYINDLEIKGFPARGGDPEVGELRVKLYPESEPIAVVGDSAAQMTRIVFHLFNFVDFMGNRRSSEPNGTVIGTTIEHMDLICDEWSVKLRSLSSTQQNIEFLKENGGYRLTHIGGIQKLDGCSFTRNDANECLTALRFFLSFIKGGWCAPICPVGFDETNHRVWEQWSSPREAWHRPLSWFDAQNTEQLTVLFAGFMKMWVNDEWQEALKETIYWYLNANFSSRGIIDAGIILTQAAIERLSYEYAVKDKHLVTTDEFKNLWASDKFRLLFSSLKIPLDIPPATLELRKLAKQKMKWLDAPRALTEIRNSLIHPEHKKRHQFDSAYFEAWNLGLWYLEMGILAICGYNGT